MINNRQRENGRSALWTGKSWTVRLAVIAAFACVIKGVIDLVFGRSVSEEVTFLIAVAIPGGILIGSIIDITRKASEKEKFKPHREG